MEHKRRETGQHSQMSQRVESWDLRRKDKILNGLMKTTRMNKQNDDLLEISMLE
jgi:hypothetical protein